VDLVEVRRLTTPQDLFQAAAEEVIRVAKAAVAERGRFTIALSGGSTPRNLYTLIAANASTSLPWAQIFFSGATNGTFLRRIQRVITAWRKKTLLSKVPVPPATSSAILGENPDASAAAESLRADSAKVFRPGTGEFPRFDLIPAGHGTGWPHRVTVSGDGGLQEKSRLVVANWVEKLNTSRISLTLPVLNAARQVAFLVGGADKAAFYMRLWKATPQGEKYPSKLVRPSEGKLIWFVDRAAASDLSPSV